MERIWYLQGAASGIGSPELAAYVKLRAGQKPGGRAEALPHVTVREPSPVNLIN
jgi:hypothetical protein